MCESVAHRPVLPMHEPEKGGQMAKATLIVALLTTAVLLGSAEARAHESARAPIIHQIDHLRGKTNAIRRTLARRPLATDFAYRKNKSATFRLEALEQWTAALSTRHAPAPAKRLGAARTLRVERRLELQRPRNLRRRPPIPSANVGITPPRELSATGLGGNAGRADPCRATGATSAGVRCLAALRTKARPAVLEASSLSIVSDVPPREARA